MNGDFCKVWKILKQTKTMKKNGVTSWVESKELSKSTRTSYLIESIKLKTVVAQQPNESVEECSDITTQLHR